MCRSFVVLSVSVATTLHLVDIPREFREVFVGFGVGAQEEKKSVWNC
jgi:hypothetical protein